MNGLRDFRKPRRRGGKIALVVIFATALLVIGAVAIGCGSEKKSDTGITFVKALPGKQTLTKGATTIIQIKRNLIFVVGVKNTGHSPAKNVKVTLLIDQNPQPIRMSVTIGQIDSGQATDVVFKGPFNVTELISKIPIKVNVTPVAGETNRSNNSATYEVRFSF